MPRSAISCSFTPSISLHATLDHILLWTLPWPPTGDNVVSFNLRIGCHPGEYPRKSSSKKDQPVLILFVCFLQLIGDLCSTIDNAMIITGIVFPPTWSPFDIKLSWTFLSPSCHQLKGGEVAEEGNRLPVHHQHYFLIAFIIIITALGHVFELTFVRQISWHSYL